MKPAYTLRQAVETDLEAIWLYTFNEWGVEQADTYTRALISRFACSAEDPRAAKQRDDVKPGHLCFPEGMHIVFYKIGEQGIDIIGIPYQSMDYVSHI